MIDCSDRYLEKVYTYMHEKLLEEDIIYADETHHDVFTEGEKGRQLKQIYIWMFRTGVTTDKKIVLYVHKGERSGKITTEFLKDYHGYLQSDDYAGYNGLKVREYYAMRMYGENLRIS